MHLYCICMLVIYLFAPLLLLSVDSETVAAPVYDYFVNDLSFLAELLSKQNPLTILTSPIPLSIACIRIVILLLLYR